MELIALLGLWRNGIRAELFPLVQVVIHGHRHSVSLINLVVANGRYTVPVDKAVSAIHAFEQTCGMVAPVKQVGARDVAPMI